MVHGMQASLLDGQETLEVVGESRYQDNLWHLVRGRADLTERVRVEIIALLVPQPDNPCDTNAVSVWIVRLAELSAWDHPAWVTRATRQMANVGAPGC
jgi:hypothetical protein